MPAPPASAKRILRDMQSRQRRRKSPFFVVEGERACTEAANRRPEWFEFALLANSADSAIGAPLQCPRYELPEDEFRELSSTDNPQGILLVGRRPTPTTIKLADPFLLILDQVRDPGNLGTILRTAWAVGLTHVVWTSGTADPWAPKTIRAGMGAQFAVSPVHADNLAAALDLANQNGYQTCWQPTPHGGTSCFAPEFHLPGSVLLIGNETVDTHNLTGNRVCIPMPGTAESLNVAQATTVLLFEAVRRNILP